jgi:pimeloyl-ACP methyl ester carboxylesterase
VNSPTGGAINMMWTAPTDDVLRFPGMVARLQQLADVLPGQRGIHILPGAGHWIQREHAAAVNALLIEFLRGL